MHDIMLSAPIGIYMVQECQNFQRRNDEVACLSLPSIIFILIDKILCN